MDRQEQKPFYSTYDTGHEDVDRQYFTDIPNNLVQNLTGYLTDGCNQTMENCQNGYISQNETMPFSPTITNNSGHSILTSCNTGHSCHQLESSVAQETVTNPFSNYISTGASYTNSPTPGTTVTTMSIVSPQLYNALQASSTNAYSNWTHSNNVQSVQSENWTNQPEFIIKTEDSDLDTDNLFSGCFDSDSASVFSSFDETDQLSQFYESDHSHCNEEGGFTQAERQDMLDGTRARTSTPQLNSAKSGLHHPFHKKEKRKKQNRDAAKRCREKKKKLLDQLFEEHKEYKTRVDKLQTENANLLSRLQEALKENSRLKERMDAHTTQCPLTF